MEKEEELLRYYRTMTKEGQDIAHSIISAVHSRSNVVFFPSTKGGQEHETNPADCSNDSIQCKRTG